MATAYTKPRIAQLLVATALLTIMAALALLAPCVANAQVTVSASGDTTGAADKKAINAALEEDGDVVLQSGKTYYTNGNIYVTSNQSITATGATIVTKNGAVRNTAQTANYSAIKNFKLIGGTWKNKDDDFSKTMVQFTHGSNITIEGATITCGIKGHAVELIACKDVLVKNCKLTALGSVSGVCVEEMLQIDIATPKTAPTVDSALTKGQTCKNITVTGCTIKGGRGVCANYAKVSADYPENKVYVNKFHENVTITNNTITGTNAEALALFNVMGATVKNNTITTKYADTSSAYSVGLHIAMFGTAPSAMSKATYNITGNTIKGGRQALYTFSHSSSLFGKVTAKKNKCYCRAGKASAIKLSSARKVVKSGNKTYKWK